MINIALAKLMFHQVFETRETVFKHIFTHREAQPSIFDELRCGTIVIRGSQLVPFLIFFLFCL